MVKQVNISFSTTRGYLRIALPKVINTKNYLQIRNRIEARLEKKADKVLLDLSNITILESLLIGLLLHTRRIVKDNNGLIYLVNVSKTCSARLHALFLDTIFTIYENEKQVFSRKD